MVESARGAVVAADADGRIVYLNPSAAALLGWKPAEITGQPLTVIMPERYRALHQAGLARYLRTGEARVIGKVLELAVLRRDGTEVPIEIAIGTWGPRGEGGFSAVIRDITQRQKGGQELEDATRRLAVYAKELERSNSDLEQFAFAASHDLQEPLRMVTSYVELLGTRYSQAMDADAKEFMGFALDGTRRMRQLINDLLTYARVTTRGKPFQPVDAGRAVAQAVQNLAEAIRESGANIDQAGLPTVTADEGQLVQLFQNLISNSLKFRSKAAPRIQVSARREGPEWHFAVQDNGIGIDPQYHERVFVIFQRLHSRTEVPGTGIGLAVCKRIVERHGGRIWVESQPGAGATFRFTIPVAPLAPAPPPTPRAIREAERVLQTSLERRAGQLV